MEFNLADLFEIVVGVVPGSTAMVTSERRLTYSELDARANSLARWLVDAGVQPGDRVGLQLANGTEYIEGMLGCFKIRAVPVNVNYRYVAKELEYLYEDSGLVGLIYHARFRSAVGEALGGIGRSIALLEVAEPEQKGPELPGSTDYEAALQVASSEGGFPARSADDLYCVYTGGTTGMPKGVLWRHEDIFFAAMGGGDPFSFGNFITEPAQLADRVLPTGSGIKALAIPPFMHAAGHWLAFSNMFGGGTVITLPRGQFDPTEAWKLVEAEGINAVVVVGDAIARPLIDVLAENPNRFDLSSMMAIGSGGAILSPSTKQRLGELLPGKIIADLFGSSETGQVGGEAPAGDPYGAPRLRVNDRTNVLDGDLKPVIPGSEVIGRLARTGYIPVGYLGDPVKTAATFVESGGCRWSLPGDMATVESDGIIKVLGRGSLSINTGGEKVFPDEVEAILKSHSDVYDAVVVGVPDERFGEQVCALVCLTQGGTLDEAGLREYCRGRLTGYKIPRRVVIVDSITRSPSGKADYPWAKKFAEASIMQSAEAIR
ncbi:MAG TPA: acyl-CoA synthetase [Acidimicrobiales bacterium]|nr:acyl-CoA synthetase [Acidimicrobiales bacterium]